MQLRYFTKKIINKVRGSMPVTVFIWYTILLFACITMIGIIMYWYYILYTTAYGSSITAVNGGEYKSIIDAQQLKEVLEGYGVK